MIAARTSTRLSDGRELIYFDESDGTDRASTADKRDLDAATIASELRRDPLTEEWVIIAAHRQARTHLPASSDCPLCPSTPDNLTEIPAGSYDVVVFENRFPSLASKVPDVEPYVGGERMYPRRPGVARCEVVAFSEQHDASFTQLAPDRGRTIVDAWADRTTTLSAVRGVQQVFPFENRGAEIGVTLGHPHGQIYAYPFVTPRSERMLAAAFRHSQTTGRNLFADVLRAELDDGSRVVAQSRYWTAFVPAAARWPVEVHVFPNRRVVDLPALDGAERDDFATVYLDVLRRFDRLYDMPIPYVSAWYQAPVMSGRQHAYLHLQLFSTRRAPDKLKYLAGSESAMGVFINDRTPERTAQMLRDAA